jgi:hypothetical protein
MINVLEASLEPVGRSLNREAALKLLEIKAPPLLQERIDVLAERCGEGVASDEELSEYDAMIQAANVIAILQAEARRVLSDPPAGLTSDL